MNEVSETNELAYSDEAATTRILFYQGLNDINIIVEDAGKEYEYETIFKRLLDNKLHIATIFSAGGKSKVIERYNEFGAITDNIKNFYIVDGDFDRYICSNNMISHPCFIYLQAYNIENYFIDEIACEQFAKSRLKCLDRIVKQKVNFSGWKKLIVHQSKKLFLCFCFLQKHKFELPTLSRSPYEFIDKQTGFEKSDGIYNEMLKCALKIDPNALTKIEELAIYYEKLNGNDYSNLICGKFLFCSLYSHLRNITKSRIDKIDLRWYLINHFDISKLDYVKNVILTS